MSTDKRTETVYVAGHQGMVGTALVRALSAAGWTRILTRSHAQLDLLEQAAVTEFLGREHPSRVYLAAAKVGGIHANDSYPADFIYQNLMIEANVMHAAWRAGVERLLFLGSSCIYPRLASQPMSESALLGGPLEPTNEPYAIAKIAGIKLCESYNRQYHTDFRSVMPTNLYGPGDNFHPVDSHVIPALMRKFHEAKVAGKPDVQVWGTGEPRREFLHVDDLAKACLHLMELDPALYATSIDPRVSHINVGTGEDVSIASLARTIAAVVGFSGRICFDPNQPDGAPRKLLYVSLINRLGWHARIDLQNGLAQTYDWFLANQNQFRGRDSGD